MKIIPTKYDGILFRSRLEARWATFFNSLKIKYEYEPESFDLDGIGYIPDFHLPLFDINSGTYCEVKPLGGSFKKAHLFCEKTGNNIWLCNGIPDFKIYYVLERMVGTPEEIWDVASWEVIPGYDSAYEENRFWYTPGFDNFGPEDCGPELREAIYAARNARFGVYEDH